MAVLTPIARVGDIRYYMCDTWASLQDFRPQWNGALCRVTDGTWYEFREFDDDKPSGTWEIYTGPPVLLSIGTSAGVISASNPMPIKTSLLSGAPAIVYNAISATPVTPYTLVLEGTGIKKIKIITSGTSTSRTMTFKAKLRSADTFTPFFGINYSNTTNTVGISTTGQGEIWSFSELDGVYALEFNVITIAGGDFTVWSVPLI